MPWAATSRCRRSWPGIRSRRCTPKSAEKVDPAWQAPPWRARLRHGRSRGARFSWPTQSPGACLIQGADAPNETVIPDTHGFPHAYDGAWDDYHVRLTKRTTGETHTVRRGRLWSCDCRAYAFGRGKPCKHVKNLKEIVNDPSGSGPTGPRPVGT